MREWLLRVRRADRRVDPIFSMSDDKEAAERMVAELNERFQTQEYYVEWYDKDNPLPIVVYRRPNPAQDGRGYSADRPWMVAQIPEDTRETCYPTWAEAIEWATMKTEDRQAFLEVENRMDAGW